MHVLWEIICFTRKTSIKRIKIFKSWCDLPFKTNQLLDPTQKHTSGGWILISRDFKGSLLGFPLVNSDAYCRIGAGIKKIFLTSTFTSIDWGFFFIYLIIRKVHDDPISWFKMVSYHGPKIQVSYCIPCFPLLIAPDTSLPKSPVLWPSFPQTHQTYFCFLDFVLALS